MAALALADRQPLGVAAAHGDDRLRHQRVMDDDVGFHQQALRAQRQQIFGARAGADQRDVARAGASLRSSSAAACDAPATAWPASMARAGAPAKKSLQKRRRGTALRQQPLGSIAKRCGQRRQRAERRRQQLVDLRAHHLRQHGAGAFGADGDGRPARG